MAKLRACGRTVCAIHLRRGDYRELADHEWVYVPPNSWYVKFLRSIWNEADASAADFAEVAPLAQRQLGVETPGVSEYVDYAVSATADRVAISKSTFSFQA